MRRRILAAAAVAAVMALGTAAPAAANEPTAACNGLDTAHDQIHGTGTEAEAVLHELRLANHCDH